MGGFAGGFTVASPERWAERDGQGELAEAEAARRRLLDDLFHRALVEATRRAAGK